MKKKQYLAWFLAAAVMTGMSTVPAAAEELRQISAESSADETAEVHEDDSDAVLSDTVVADPADETEANSGDNSSQTEETDTGSDTDTPVSNEEAFDDLILEDENGVMEEDDGSTSGPEAGKGTGNTGNTDTGLGELEEITDVAKQTGQYLEDINITVEKEEVTNWGESLITFQAYPVGDLSENEARVYEFLREELGLNKAAASGVMANILCESAFSSVAVGDSGTSYGLCQWHAGRFSNLVNWCIASGYDYHLVEGQLHYLQAELESGYRGVYDYLLNVPDTERGAYQAGYYWCMHFEMPNDTVSRSLQRGKIAMNNYYTADLDTLKEEGLSEAGKRRQELLEQLFASTQKDPSRSMEQITSFCMYGTLTIPDETEMTDAEEEIPLAAASLTLTDPILNDAPGSNTAI